MDYRTLDKIFRKPNVRRQIEYVSADENLMIIETSEEAVRFADTQEVESLVGKDLRLAFPELVGLEDLLLTLFKEEVELFDLKGIERFSCFETTVYFDLYVVIDKDDKTDRKIFIVLLEDVTERMILEQKVNQKINECNLLLSALSESEAYLNKIVSSIADALIVTNLSGKIKQVNRAVQELFGYSESELLGQPISMIFGSQIQWPHPWEKNEKSSQIEVTCKTKKQEKITVAFSRSAFPTDMENIKNFVYTGRDITLDKLTESFLRESEEIYRFLFYSMREGAALYQIIWDSKGQAIDYLILDTNPAYSQIIGWPREKIVGKLGTQLYQTEIAPAIEIFAEVARTGKSVTFEMCFDPLGKFLNIFACSYGRGKFATFVKEIYK
ncbi:MAG TPA: PAS domain S-box protein [Halomicronema sp.]